VVGGGAHSRVHGDFSISTILALDCVSARLFYSLENGQFELSLFDEGIIREALIGFHK